MWYIEPTAWESIYDFWKENNGFDKKIEPCASHLVFDRDTWVHHTSYLERADKCLVLSTDDRTKHVGCVRLLTKHYEGFKVCGLGKFAIDYKYRRKGLSKMLLDVCVEYMILNNYDLSILWASVLRVYDKVGYVPIYKNMMVKWLRPVDKTVQYWRDSIQTLGTW